MRIGILGSGLMGAKLGTIFARAGHEVVFSSPAASRSSKGSRARLERTRARAHRARPLQTQMLCCWQYIGYGPTT
jgi:predicted dinucleotide-binding enzyme